MRILAIGLLLALGCGDDVDVGREGRDGPVGDSDAAVDAGCVATLNVTLVFHEHVAGVTYVRCEGLHAEGIEESLRAMSAGYPCAAVPEPDLYHYTFEWDPDVGPCEFCNNFASRDALCLPIEAGCGVKKLEDIHVGICDDDASVDDDSGTN